MNNDIWNPAGSIELAHRQALTCVCDAYLFHLVSLYLADKGWSMERRRAHYINILDLIRYMGRKNSDFIDWGTVPTLTPRGIRWLNACFSRLGDMVNSYGGWEGYITATKKGAGQ